MISMHLIIDVCAGGLLLATFMMIGQVRLRRMLFYFAVASFFLAGLGASISLLRGDHLPYLGAIATIIFKVILIPLFIAYTARRIPSSYQLRSYLRPSSMYFLFAFALIVSGLIVRNLPLNFQEDVAFQDVFFFRSLVFISVGLIMSGISLLITRKDLFSQVLGLMTMENGIAAFALVALDSLPLFLEMGIFFVIMISALILGILTEKVHEVYAVGDTDILSELVD